MSIAAVLGRLAPCLRRSKVSICQWPMLCGAGLVLPRPAAGWVLFGQRLNNKGWIGGIAAGRYDYDKTRLMTSGEAALACYCASASSCRENRSPREHGYPRAIGLWPPGLNSAHQSTASRYPFSASAVSHCRPVTYRTGERARCFAPSRSQCSRCGCTAYPDDRPDNRIASPCDRRLSARRSARLYRHQTGAEE